MRSSLIAGVIVLAGFTSLQELSKPELKKRLKDEAHADWIYDDLPAAFAAAKQSGKPVLAVFRCVP